MSDVTLDELERQLENATTEAESLRLEAQLLDAKRAARIAIAKARAAALEAQEKARAEDLKLHRRLKAQIRENEEKAKAIELTLFDALKTLFDTAEQLTALEHERLVDWNDSLAIANRHGFDKLDHPRRGLAGGRFSDGGTVELDLPEWFKRYALIRARVRQMGKDPGRVDLRFLVQNNEFLPHVEEL